jgi:hypothetical protein
MISYITINAGSLLIIIDFFQTRKSKMTKFRCIRLLFREV